MTMAGNFHFDITGAPLAQALAVAAVAHKQVEAHKLDRDGKRLILFWAEAPDSHPLPAPLEGDALAAFVKAWLQNVDYGREPDIDGSTGKGCRVYNEAWGYITGELSGEKCPSNSLAAAGEAVQGASHAYLRL